MLSRVKQYFIGEVIPKENRPFEKLQIELLYSLVIVWIPLHMISIIPLAYKSYWFMSSLHIITYLGSILTLFIIKYSKSYRLAGIIWLILGANCLNVLTSIICGGFLNIINILWVMVSIITSFVILDRKLGLLNFIANVLIIVILTLVLRNMLIPLEIDAFAHEQDFFYAPSVVYVIIPVLFIGYVLFRYLSVKKEIQQILIAQKKAVIRQKNIIEKKNTEVIDSIEYAAQIQNAMLSHEDEIKEYFPDSFVLYLPKDRVSGDFYFIDHFDDSIIFCVGDCTGHGVPGAIISVLSSKGLDSVIQDYKLTDPSKILNHLDSYLEKSFKKSKRRDGLDIAMCSIDKQKQKLIFAGANNSLLLLRDGTLEEYKGQRQPVGRFENKVEFVSTVIDIKKGDIIYLYSDGYVDQFGGSKGKKLKSKAFKKLLIDTMNNDNFELQKDALLSYFNDWKGDIEQLDDVCVMGVKI